MPNLRRLKVVLLPTCVLPTAAQGCGMTLVARQPLIAKLQFSYRFGVHYVVF